MKALRLLNCSDPMMWYRDKVGDVVAFVREYDDCYMSREPAGYLNIVKKQDAEIVDLLEHDNAKV